MRFFLASLLWSTLLLVASVAPAAPNIVLIVVDDQPPKAISAYEGTFASTPNIDRIATDGVRFSQAFVSNPICSPSRATILTGKFSNANGVYTNDAHILDASQQTFVDLLHTAGYQTAVFGKWHLATDPSSLGFDHYEVFPDSLPSGRYDDQALDIDGVETAQPGTYITDLLTTRAITWMEARDTSTPFLVMLSHKATHAPWIPACAVPATCAANTPIEEPTTFEDTLAGRALPIQGILNLTYPSQFDQWNAFFAGIFPGKRTITGSTEAERRANTYQAYANDFKRTNTDLDEAVGVLLDYLEAEPCSPSCSGTLDDNTLVIYMADNGLFIAEHGMFQKQSAYEEAIRVPLMIRYPGNISAGTARSELVNNADIAETILSYAGVTIPGTMQGRSLSELLDGSPATDWRTATYFQYYGWSPVNGVVPWYGLRTSRYKLIYHYGQEWGGSPEWELIDLETDPGELTNVYHDEQYAAVVTQLKAELVSRQTELGITPIFASCPGDMNQDGVITMTDVFSVRQCFGLPAAGACALADLNGDGFVTASDYIRTARAFGQSCDQ